MEPGRSEFSSPRAFQRGSQNCRSPYGSLANLFFVCFHWKSNPAVLLTLNVCQYYYTLTGKPWCTERNAITLCTKHERNCTYFAKTFYLGPFLWPPSRLCPRKSSRLTSPTNLSQEGTKNQASARRCGDLSLLGLLCFAPCLILFAFFLFISVLCSHGRTGHTTSDIFERLKPIL